MRVHIGQHKTEGRELVNWLDRAGRPVQVTVPDHAAAAEPPPELPCIRAAGRIGFEDVTLLLVPELQVFLRGPALLIRQFHQRRMQVAHQHHKDQSQQSEDHGDRARSGMQRPFAPVTQHPRAQQIVHHPKNAGAGQRKEQRHHEIEANPTGDTAEVGKRRRDHVSKIVVADAVATHPGIIRGEGRAVLDRAGEGHLHRLFCAGERWIQRADHRPAQEQG